MPVLVDPARLYAVLIWIIAAAVAQSFKSAFCNELKQSAIHPLLIPSVLSVKKFSDVLRSERAHFALKQFHNVVGDRHAGTLCRDHYVGQTPRRRESGSGMAHI